MYKYIEEHKTYLWYWERKTIHALYTQDFWNITNVEMNELCIVGLPTKFAFFLAYVLHDDVISAGHGVQTPQHVMTGNSSLMTHQVPKD